MKPEGYSEALALTKRAPFVFLSTLADGGFPETRVLFNLLQRRADALSSGPARPRSDFATYLGTNTGSRKVAQMRSDPRVCLYYADEDRYEGCMVRGRVVEVEDRSTRVAVWTPEWDMYYQGGLDGGDFSLIAFDPEFVRYYHELRVLSFDPRAVDA
ncbi:MAG TPA: pyridoxamine 5'-phosphate oxidase family protein [Treponemataceae bacterium]|nr:pyridoxamine 5'-phosphate oxidase family protein [Treponemataceae bacterium]